MVRATGWVILALLPVTSAWAACWRRPHEMLVLNFMRCFNRFVAAAAAAAPNASLVPFVTRRCPDAVHFRIKPVIGGTYQTLKEKLTGLGADFQVTDRSELAFEGIKKALL